MPALFDRIYKSRVVPALMRLAGTDVTDSPAVWHAPDEHDYPLKRVIAGNVQTELREDEFGGMKKYDVRTFIAERFPEAFLEGDLRTQRQLEAMRGYIAFEGERWAVEEIEAATGSLVRFRTCRIQIHARQHSGFRTAV